MKKKRLFGILLIFVFVTVSVLGCGKQKNEVSKNINDFKNDSVTETEKPTQEEEQLSVTMEKEVPEEPSFSRVFFMSAFVLTALICYLSEYAGYAIITFQKVTVLQGGSLPNLRKRGGGANGYIRNLNFVNSFRNVSNCTACLY